MGNSISDCFPFEFNTANMGNNSSSASKEPKQTTLAYLKERYPFSESEILRLVRCHSYLRSARKIRQSFLSDWAVFCATLPPDIDTSLQSHPQLPSDETLKVLRMLRKKRAHVMSIIEGRVLPSGFGRRLERVAFLLPKDIIDYRSSSMVESPTATPIITKSVHPPRIEEDYHYNCTKAPCIKSPCCCFFCSDEEEKDRYNRRALLSNPPSTTTPPPDRSLERLDTFLQGASECSRRGAKASFSILFQCCTRTNHGRVTSDDSFVSSPSSGEMMASAEEVLDLGYSLALASTLLTSDEEELINEQKNNNLVEKAALDALVKSLKEYCTTHSSPSYHSTNGTTSSSSSNSSEDQTIPLHLFLEWSERTVPLLHSCFATFMHTIYFPDLHVPSIITQFEFPNLKGNTSPLLGDKHSTLLFSLACMSPNLSGTVRGDGESLCVCLYDGLVFLC